MLVLVQQHAVRRCGRLGQPCSGVMAAYATCLIFTPDTWQVAQSVAVQGVQEGSYQLEHRVDALHFDSQYANLPAPSVNITVAPASGFPSRSVFLPYVMR
ncbi:MAG: hypothetical protein R2854_15340 [Caldilineaceae bacterium]